MRRDSYINNSSSDGSQVRWMSSPPRAPLVLSITGGWEEKGDDCTPFSIFSDEFFFPPLKVYTFRSGRQSNHVILDIDPSHVFYYYSPFFVRCVKGIVLDECPRQENTCRYSCCVCSRHSHGINNMHVDILNHLLSFSILVDWKSTSTKVFCIWFPKNLNSTGYENFNAVTQSKQSKKVRVE